MFYNVTLNNGTAVIGRGDSVDKPLEHLERLKGAVRLKIEEYNKDDVVKELKDRAIAEIGRARRIWEKVISIFLCGYKTTEQKIKEISFEIINKSFEIELPPIIEEKKDDAIEDVEELLNTEDFKAVNNALKKNRFEQARHLTHSAKIKNPDQVRNFIILKEIDYLICQGIVGYIPELLANISDRAIKKDILNRIERVNAEREYPQIAAFLNAEKSEPLPNAGAKFFDLMDVDKLDEALLDLKGRESNRVVTKIAEYYLEKGKLALARNVIPFLSDNKLKAELYIKLANGFLKVNLMEECLEILSFLPDEIEGIEKKEVVRTVYSKTKNKANVYRILHESPGRDAALLTLVSACASIDNYNDADSFARSIEIAELRDQAFNLIIRRKKSIEKECELIAFAESFVEANFTVPLPSIDAKRLKKVIAELDEKILVIESSEKRYACYDYLASVDHFEFAHAFALKSTHRISLILKYGLYREAEIASRIKKVMPIIPAINEMDDYNLVLKKLQTLKISPDFYNAALTYFKGRLIESYINNKRFEEAMALTATIRFIDTQIAIKAIIDQEKGT